MSERWPSRITPDNLLQVAILAVAVIGAFVLPLVDGIARVVLSIVVAVAVVGAVTLVVMYIARRTEEAAERGVERALEAVREFAWEPDKGIMKLGGIRNVALRTATLQTLMDQLIVALPRGHEEVVRGSGKAIGDSFALDFAREVLGPEGVTTGVNRKALDLWTRYDGYAGFGRLDFGDLAEESIAGTIRLHYSFLTADRAADRKRLCCFMEGYLEGFLCRLSGRDVQVKCICPNNPFHQLCKFAVSVT